MANSESREPRLCSCQNNNDGAFRGGDDESILFFFPLSQQCSLTRALGETPVDEGRATGGVLERFPAGFGGSGAGPGSATNSPPIPHGGGARRPVIGLGDSRTGKPWRLEKEIGRGGTEVWLAKRKWESADPIPIDPNTPQGECHLCLSGSRG